MFHVGQHVVCVDAGGAPSLKNGAVYTVACVIGPGLAIWESRGFRGKGYGILLIEAAPRDGYHAFAPQRFRPLSSTRLDVFRALLTKTPAPVPATHEAL